MLSMANLPFEDEENGDLALQEARLKLAKPPMYKVLLLNDDFTPMDFVVSILQTLFYKDKEEAVRITMNVHTSGIGVCGVYTKDVAETKTQQVIAYAQENQHPLQCTLEEVG
ncbi:MAG: ATP-dependent Clp protease adaptor ClpS [Cycloclasticus sp. symbiont of Poecilosclerida sp. N]|nr:MAG: ATP-dependent Clp protease adaptor ClpS [Cycloclasticus sp. symbiont of Poecilosclerida sp. N]